MTSSKDIISPKPPAPFKIKVGEKEVEVVEADVISAKEFWNEYELADGHTVMVREQLTHIVRVKDSPNNAPMYYLWTKIPEWGVRVK